MSGSLITAVGEAGDGEVRCWCCGALAHTDRVVALGEHPEVRLCLRCAHVVHRRAREIEDDGRRGPASLARDRLRTLRAQVTRRGWQHHPFTGRPLRWLGRYLP